MGLLRWLYTVPLRFRSLVRRDVVEAEMNEELQDHVDRQIALHVSHGMTPEAARRSALLAMGGLTRCQEEIRDARRVGFVDNLLRDLAHGLRLLRRYPGFTVVALLTFAVGIGANTAIFSVVNAVLLKPLPYAHPDQLVTFRSTLAPGVILDLAEASRSFEQMGAEEYWTPTFSGGDRPEQITAVRITASMFPLLGVSPIRGRVFRPDEDRTGENRVVVITHGFWTRRLGADPSVLEHVLTLNGEGYRVIGVMPPGFQFSPYWATEAELAAPIAIEARRADRRGASLRGFARVRPGRSLRQAQAELTAIATRMEATEPGVVGAVRLVPLHEVVVEDVERSLLILVAAVGLLLLIASANVAHLQLVRAASRRRESAVRSALGASRGRVMQQTLAESTLLGLAGGTLGLGLAWLAIRVLVAFGPAGIPRLETVTLDGTVFLFVLLASLLVGVLSGAAPALGLSRPSLHPVLKEGGRGAVDGGPDRRFRGLLVVSEVAFACVLLVGAGLVGRSFLAMLRADPGFDRRNVLSLRVSVVGTSDAERDQRAAFFEEVQRRVAALPGVQMAGAINHVPLNGDDWHFPFTVEGRPTREDERLSAQFLVARPGYFETMRIPVRRGRGFSREDIAAGAHVLVVNETMAERYWPGEAAIGRRISVDAPERGADWFTIVGVVGDVRQGSWVAPRENQMYFPSIRDPDPVGHAGRLVSFLDPVEMTLVLRTAGAPSALAGPVAGVVQSLNGGAVVAGVATMDEAIAGQLAQPVFYLALIGAFAGVALLLAVVGVYGVISYAVARRVREIGLRMALGAGRGRIVRLVIRQGIRPVIAGSIVGLAGAVGLSRFLRSLLFEVQPGDPITFVLVAAVLLAVSAVACWIPARRAARADAMESLRVE